MTGHVCLQTLRALNFTFQKGRQQFKRTRARGSAKPKRHRLPRAAVGWLAKSCMDWTTCASPPPVVRFPLRENESNAELWRPLQATESCECRTHGFARVEWTQQLLVEPAQGLRHGQQMTTASRTTRARRRHIPPTASTPPRRRECRPSKTPQSQGPRTSWAHSNHHEVVLASCSSRSRDC